MGLSKKHSEVLPILQNHLVWATRAESRRQLPVHLGPNSKYLSKVAIMASKRIKAALFGQSLDCRGICLVNGVWLGNSSQPGSQIVY